MPVVCVYNPLSHTVVRRYYCMTCFRALRRVALRAIPTLTESAKDYQAGKQLAVLLGIEKDVKQELGEFIDEDIELHFPVEHVLNRVPFEKFYEEARRERAG